MTRCFWIRHAPVAQSGCYTGRSDVAAILPARDARRVFPLPEGARWCASPLARAVETARWLMPAEAELHVYPALQEQDFGVWEGRRYDEVWQEAEHAHDWAQPERVRPEGGESFLDVCARVDAWLEGMLAAHAGEALVVVTHAGVVRAALRHALGVEAARALAFTLDYGSVTQVAYGPQGAVVECVNRLEPG